MKTVQHFTTTPNVTAIATTRSPCDEHAQITVVAIVCYAIISLVGVIANLAIIRKLARHKRKSSEYFILNLATTDLVVCSLCIPLDIYDQLHERWQYGAFLCKIIYPFQTIFTLISILTLTAMAVERYRAIMTPFKPNPSRSDLLKAIAVIWLIGLCVIAPYVYHLRYDGDTCHEQWPDEMSAAYYSLSLLIIDYCIPLIIITFCYGRAGYRLYVNAREFNAVNAAVSNDAQRARLARNTRVIKIFSFAVFVFLVCMMPGDIYWMWRSFGPDSALCDEMTFVKHFQTATNIFIYSNSCFNPFIFGACHFGCFNSRFPWPLRRKLKLKRLFNVNSLSADGNKHDRTVSANENTQSSSAHDEILLDYDKLKRLRETDI